MLIPDQPPIGSLVAYEYLWLSQSTVRDDGLKVYPAALLFAKKIIGGVTLAHAVGLSHKPPAPSEKAIEIPGKLKRHLGLDDQPAWIYTDQINQFAWPGYDLRPAEWLSKLPRARGTCVIGPLPTDWFALIRDVSFGIYGQGTLESFTERRAEVIWPTVPFSIEPEPVSRVTCAHPE